MKEIKIFLVFLISFSSYSQQKFEKEYRIKSEAVPNKALEFIKNIGFTKKIKWYAEESNDGKTIEAKTCFNKHLFSIEFNEEGTLLDIEKKVDFKSLPLKAQDKILKKLSKIFMKFKVKKTQIQFKGLPKELKNIFDAKDRNEIKARISYELIIKGKKETYALFEFLFEEKGNLIKQLQIKPEISLNLEF